MVFSNKIVAYKEIFLTIFFHFYQPTIVGCLFLFHHNHCLIKHFQREKPIEDRLRNDKIRSKG